MWDVLNKVCRRLSKYNFVCFFFLSSSLGTCSISRIKAHLRHLANVVASLPRHRNSRTPKHNSRQHLNFEYLNFEYLQFRNTKCENDDCVNRGGGGNNKLQKEQVP